MLTQLGPIQKSVLSIIAQLAPLAAPDAWSDVLRTMCRTLCPFKTLPLRYLCRALVGGGS